MPASDSSLKTHPALVLIHPYFEFLQVFCRKRSEWIGLGDGGHGGEDGVFVDKVFATMEI